MKSEMNQIIDIVRSLNPEMAEYQIQKYHCLILNDVKTIYFILLSIIIVY